MQSYNKPKQSYKAEGQNITQGVNKFKNQKMRVITGILFFLNLAAWIFFDIVCWIMTGVTLGLIVLIGIISFLIAWGLSEEAVIAPFDYLAQPSWDVFVKKIKWSNYTCVIVMSIFALVFIVFDWFNLRDFFNIIIE